MMNRIYTIKTALMELEPNRCSTHLLQW